MGKKYCNFNPRSHEGSDNNQLYCSRKDRISTHAPTRGATDQESERYPAGRFQPTLPRGERHKLSTYLPTNYTFQPTLPRGERRIMQRYRIFSFRISTHAPTRGATGRGYFIPDMNIISTHAPTRGATIRRIYYEGISSISTHAPTRGATL